MTKEEILLKLVRDMEVRGRSRHTIEGYEISVRLFQEHFDKPADQMGEQEINEYLHYLLTEKKLSQGSVNKYNSALRFVYGVTLDVVLNYKRLPRLKQIRSLPQLYTKEDVRKIIESAGSIKHKAWLMLAYGSGLRRSEVLNLRVSDIDSKKMRIFIRQGKGGRDRYALLPEATLLVLREYWLQNKPKDLLFVSPFTGAEYNGRSIEGAFKSALEKSGVQKYGTIHTLRHCFATHMLEAGHSVYAIKKLLGHVRIDTTIWYAQLADSDVLKLRSPIDALPKKRGGKPKNAVGCTKNV